MREPADRPITSKERVRFAGVLAALMLVSLASFDAGCELEPRPLADAAIVVPSTRAPSETAAYVMRQAESIIEQMAADYPNVVPPTLNWRPCGEENGYYDPRSQEITICAEDLEHPDWVIQVAAHEFGHAVTDQLADITDENAADELSILAMADHGWWDEMLGAAMYMRENWPAAHMPGDPHPGGAYRAWEIMCAEEGAEGYADPTRRAAAECVSLYRGLVVKWDHRLPRAGRPHATAPRSFGPRNTPGPDPH